MKKTINIFVHIPHLFNVRDFIYTNLPNLAKNSNYHFYFYPYSESLNTIILEMGMKNFHLVDKKQIYANLRVDAKIMFIISLMIYRFSYFFDEIYLLDTLKQRFLIINKFKNIHIFSLKSLLFRQIQKKYLYDWRRSTLITHPFPKSSRMFNFLKFIRFNILYSKFSEFTFYFRFLNIDLVVLTRPDFPISLQIKKTATGLSINTIAYISSWDHPTTKGPILPNVTKYLSQSSSMSDELITFHDITPEKINLIGRVQHDELEIIVPDLYKKITNKYETNPYFKRFILFGTNCEGLNWHEISIAKYLAEKFDNDFFPNSKLVIRLHPQLVEINDWCKLSSENVLVIQSDDFRKQRYSDLYNEDIFLLEYLLKKTDIVIQSRSSLIIDAMRFRKPVISLAYNGNIICSNDHDDFKHEYDYRHYIALKNLKSNYMVFNNNQLINSINKISANLHNPHISDINQEYLYFLGPGDNFSTKRLFNSLKLN
jgi:hypothetical protein